MAKNPKGTKRTSQPASAGLKNILQPSPAADLEKAPAECPENPISEVDAPAVEEKSPRFPIVGIGASAGGLAAFEAFFSHMPAETESGMAFVLIQHLDPNHKSILTDLISSYTRMQVYEVQADGR